MTLLSIHVDLDSGNCLLRLRDVTYTFLNICGRCVLVPRLKGKFHCATCKRSLEGKLAVVLYQAAILSAHFYYICVIQSVEDPVRDRRLSSLHLSVTSI